MSTEDATASPHSRFGGSVAARVLNCPASVRLLDKVPANLRKVSSYAERGTALHAAITFLLGALDEDEPAWTLERLIDHTIGGYTITRDDVENALTPVMACLNTLIAPGAEFYVECCVIFPGVDGAFGTIDLLVRIGNTIHVVDHKFGTGVRVLALRPDGDADVINAQLMFYAAAGRHSYPEFFAGGDSTVLTILQPNSIDPDAAMISSVSVTNAELDDFIANYCDACKEATLAEAPHLERGTWCKFCAARPICPAHTGPLLDLAQFVLPTPGLGVKENYLRALGDGLMLLDAIKDISVALRDQATAALEAGDVVPGYALSAGRAERHWRDEASAAAELKHIGLTLNDLTEERMRSPKQVELRAKARGLRVPPELIDSHRSGVALVRAEDARAPVLGRNEIVRSFTEAITALMEDSTHAKEYRSKARSCELRW